mgnify:CR=1 FL=1
MVWHSVTSRNGFEPNDGFEQHASTEWAPMRLWVTSRDSPRVTRIVSLYSFCFKPFVHGSALSRSARRRPMTTRTMALRQSAMRQSHPGVTTAAVCSCAYLAQGLDGVLSHTLACVMPAVRSFHPDVIRPCSVSMSSRLPRLPDEPDGVVGYMFSTPWYFSVLCTVTLLLQVGLVTFGLLVFCPTGTCIFVHYLPCHCMFYSHCVQCRSVFCTWPLHWWVGLVGLSHTSALPSGAGNGLFAAHFVATHTMLWGAAALVMLFTFPKSTQDTIVSLVVRPPFRLRRFMHVRCSTPQPSHACASSCFMCFAWHACVRARVCWQAWLRSPTTPAGTRQPLWMNSMGVFVTARGHHTGIEWRGKFLAEALRKAYMHVELGFALVGLWLECTVLRLVHPAHTLRESRSVMLASLTEDLRAASLR